MRLLIHFNNDHHWIDFRYAELYSLLCMIGMNESSIPFNSNGSNEITHENYVKDNLFIVELPDDKCNDIINIIRSRSVLIKGVYELWGYATSFQQLIDQIKCLPSDFIDPLLVYDNTWSIEALAICRTLTMEQKELYRQNFRFLQFKGSVDRKKPTVNLHFIIDFSDNLNIPFNEQYPIVPSYFGRLLTDNNHMKDILNKYDLKKRLYLGPTSLDHSLALIMCNLTRIRKNDFVLDPFVGTASILIGASHLGGICFGTDIDIRVLKGIMYAGKADRTVDTTRRDIFANFEAYGLTKPELIRLDNHLIDRHLHQIKNNNNDNGNDSIDCGFFDVIVTDPPYGIRAGAKKSGKKDPLEYTIDPDRRHDHCPATQMYPVEEVMLDLLHTAAKYLVNNGYFTYLIPTPYGFTVDDLPKHPCLKVEMICEQSLSARHGRHAVVMKKVRVYNKESLEEFQAYKSNVLSGNDTTFGTLLGRLKAALEEDRLKIAEDTSIVERRSKNCIRRLTSKQRRHEKYKEAPKENESI